jgi:methylenetetrahydrofolate dehydrogenase (NADP+)/methenyltetrahydrofolate cyclohydrolase/formyltetrahydrofolate synthetase
LLHAYTKNPEQITSEADIVVADVGIPNIVRGNWIKKGAVVIDLGTNQIKVTTKIFTSIFIGLLCLLNA